MKVKVVENPPVDPREFDLPAGFKEEHLEDVVEIFNTPLVGCLLYTSPSPRDVEESRMPSSA